MLERVEYPAFVEQAEVKVRGRVPNARAPDFAEERARLHAVADFHRVAREM